MATDQVLALLASARAAPPPPVFVGLFFLSLRANIDDSYFFELPAEWLVAGTGLTLQAVINPSHSVIETNYANNVLYTSPLAFVASKRLKVHLVNYSYIYNSARITPQSLTSSYVVDGVTSVFPIDRLNVTSVVILDNTGLPVALGGTGTGFTFFDNQLNVPFAFMMLSKMQVWRLAFEPGDFLSVYHTLYGLPQTPVFRLGATGLANDRDSVSLVSNISLVGNPQLGRDMATVVAHEPGSMRSA